MAELAASYVPDTLMIAAHVCCVTEANARIIQHAGGVYISTHCKISRTNVLFSFAPILNASSYNLYQSS